jgi:hypothetical protein
MTAESSLIHLIGLSEYADRRIGVFPKMRRPVRFCKSLLLHARVRAALVAQDVFAQLGN